MFKLFLNCNQNYCSFDIIWDCLHYILGQIVFSLYNVFTSERGEWAVPREVSMNLDLNVFFCNWRIYNNNIKQMCEMSSYLVATSRSCSRATIKNGRRPWPNFWMCQGTYVPDICWHLIHINYISVSYSVAWGHLKPCKLTMCGRVRWSTFKEALLSYLDVEICRVSVYACLRRGTLVSKACENADTRPEVNAKEFHCSLLVLKVELMSSEHVSDGSPWNAVNWIPRSNTVLIQ